MYVHIYLNGCVYICASMNICVHIHMYAGKHVYAHTSTYLCLDKYKHQYSCVSLFTKVCMSTMYM